MLRCRLIILPFESHWPAGLKKIQARSRVADEIHLMELLATATDHDALDALPHGVIVLDAAYRYVFVNSEAERFLARDRSQLIGRNHWELFAAARGTVMDREYRRAFATGSRVRFRYFHSASRNWFDITAKTDSSDRLVVSMQDTTDLCRLEHALDSVEYNLCEAFRNATIGVAITDANGRFLEVNEAYCTITGYSRDELRERDFLAITHTDDRKRHMEASGSFGDDESGTIVYEKRYVRKNGSIVWVRNNVSVMLRSERQTKRLILLCEDITEARAAEEKLKESERRFRTLIEGSLDVITVLRPDGEIVYESPALERLLGYKPEDLVGKNAFDYIHPGDLPAILKELEQKRRVPAASSEVLFRFLHKNGSWRYMEGAAANLIEDPAIAGIVANCRDVTDRVETLRKLAEALEAAKEATEMKSRFLANMSHEIRTPMNGVIGLAELLLDTALSEEQREYVQGIQFSADALLRIIGDILDFSKIEAGKLDIDRSPYDFRTLLSSLGALFVGECQSKRVRFALHIGEDVPAKIMGDALRVRQVLTNLLANAVKFTHFGSITLKATCVNVGSSQRWIRVAVLDTGVGIAPEHQRRLFESFTQADSSTTRRFGGTGLGLAICKQLLELMGGQIGFSSVPEEGSEFWFELPLEPAPDRNAVSDTRETRTRTPAPARILVAEDNAVNQQITRAILQKAGYTVDIASDGTEVLRALSAAEYNLVIMDVQMPGMDGYQTTRAIRNLDTTVRSIPVMAMTANAMIGDRERCLGAGMDEYISKPVHAAEILSKVGALLSNSNRC
jgi:PAS domain S-box-containing protein